MASSSPSTRISQFNRIRPKKPLDVWSTREKLCLASAVFKIGDQNWVSVSRAIKPYADSSRPPDWFHQKNCVLQYYDMLEQLEQPKRKRGDKAESDAPSLQIMRQMTIERSEQLRKEMLEMQQEFKQLKADAEAIEAGHWDDRLDEEWESIKAEQKIKEEDVTVEVTDMDQKDLKDFGLTGDADESTQDSLGDNVDVSGLSEEIGLPSSIVTSTPEVSSSLDVSGKMPVSSHLLSSLLQSDVKTANELQQLRMEQEQGNLATHQSQLAQSLLSSPHQRSLLKPQIIPDTTQQSSATSSSSTLPHSSRVPEPSPSISKLTCHSASTSSLTTGTGLSSASTTATNTTTTNAAPDLSWETIQDGDSKCDLEDSHVDVTTEVVEETVQTDVDSAVSDQTVMEASVAAVIPKVEPEETDSPGFPLVETVQEEVVRAEETVVKMVVKTEDELEEVVVEEELKDSTTELDVEGLDCTKEDIEKDSQDEEDHELKPLPESLASMTDTELVEAVLKSEPLSPTSSISSRISESGSKRGRGRGRPKGSKSRVSSRKSYTDDERKDDGGSSKFSDGDLSEEDIRDTEDLLSGALAASTTGSILSESFPNSPASLSICSDTEEEKSYKQWKKSIMLVWRAAATHKYANVFLHPVTDDIAPGYKSVVLRPMDLSTIKKNVETGAIRATVEFQRDLMLMFSNAIMYNSSDHNVYRMATEMYDDVMQHIEQYVNTQMMVQTTDAKNLRQSRRADASDKEEDSKKRRLSVDQQEGGKTKKRKTRLDESLP